MASSPDGGDCEKMMERNIEQFSSVSSIGKDEDHMSDSRRVSPVKSRLLSALEAVMTPYRPPSRGVVVSQGSEAEL